MTTALNNIILTVACVTGGALFAYAIASMVAAVGGASLLPMSTTALVGSGALMGLTLAAASARPAIETNAS